MNPETVYKITLPWPPSLNGYWRSIPSGGKSTRQIISKKGREFRQAVELRVSIARANGDIREALTGRLKFSVYLYPPDRRKRDIANFSDKAICDALTHAGIWMDDEQIDEHHAYRCKVEKPGKAVVEIEVL